MKTLLSGTPSVSARGALLVDRLVADADALRIAVRPARPASASSTPARPRRQRRSRPAARRDLHGRARPRDARSARRRALADVALACQLHQPRRGCLGSQYAGWTFRDEAGGQFFSLGSGPARALVAQGKAFRRAGLRRPSQPRRPWSSRATRRRLRAWRPNRCATAA